MGSLSEAERKHLRLEYTAIIRMKGYDQEKRKYRCQQRLASSMY